MQAGHYSSLLPDLFRHKTTKVRLFQPQIILMDFHGTISERRWEDKVIFPYVKRSINQFVRDNFATETVQRCLPGLKNESFEQRFRNKYEDAPVIEDHTELMWDRDEDHQHQLQMADQVGEFLLWQIQTKRETRETQTIERLVWQDGFRRKQISVPIYEDVMSCVRDWRDQHQIGLYVTSSLDPETLKMFFENTDKGNLQQYLSGYLCSRRPGDKLISDTYKQFYDKTILARSSSSSSSSSAGKASGSRAQSATISFTNQNSTSGPRQSPQPAAAAQQDSNRCNKSPPKSPRGSIASDTGTAKPILFLTDAGQEAKAASMSADGAAYDCLLVNRPGNKRIRTYYLSHFQYIDKFDDIEFIQ